MLDLSKWYGFGPPWQSQSICRGHILWLRLYRSRCVIFTDWHYDLWGVETSMVIPWWVSAELRTLAMPGSADRQFSFNACPVIIPCLSASHRKLHPIVHKLSYFQDSSPLSWCAEIHLKSNTVLTSYNAPGYNATFVIMPCFVTPDLAVQDSLFIKPMLFKTNVQISW